MQKSKKDDYIRESLRMFSEIESFDSLKKIYTFIKVSHEYESKSKTRDGEEQPITNQESKIIDLLLRKNLPEEKLELIYRFVRGM